MYCIHSAFLYGYKYEASALARKQLEESNETKEIVCGIDEKMDHLDGKLNVGNEKLDSLVEQLYAKLDAIGNTLMLRRTNSFSKSMASKRQSVWHWKKGIMSWNKS